MHTLAIFLKMQWRVNLSILDVLKTIHDWIVAFTWNIFDILSWKGLDHILRQYYSWNTYRFYNLAL